MGVPAVPKTVIPVGNVGVVVFYTGPHTADVSGEEYRHGELVMNGSRGVWKAPLLPGKYAFNTYAGKVEVIPTVNFILKWMRGESHLPKLRPMYLGEKIANATRHFYTRHRPEKDAALWAVKALA